LDLIEHWESAHVAMPSAPPREVLRLLLASNKLKQKDLSDIASSTLLSDILAGRREISKRLAKLLAARFHVNIGAFIYRLFSKGGEFFSAGAQMFNPHRGIDQDHSSASRRRGAASSNDMIRCYFGVS
jgi:hypothetical protein